MYVFLAMEIQSRKVLHFNVTQHPGSEWTIQQFRELLAFDHPYQYVIHDRDAIFSKKLDQELRGFGVRALRTPVRAPKAKCLLRAVGRHPPKGSASGVFRSPGSDSLGTPNASDEPLFRTARRSRIVVS